MKGNHLAGLRVCLTVLIVALYSNVAFALTLDDFESGDLSVTAAGIGDVQFSVVDTSTAIGGKRSQRAEMTGGSQDLTIRTAFGFLDHSQKSTVTGESLVTWDGDSIPNLTNPTGLGGLSLQQDITSVTSTDGLVVEVISFDFPANSPVTLTLTVFSDASNASVQSQTINNQISSSTDILFAFDQFTTKSGAAGPADFTDVGAITLHVDGSNAAIDLTIGKFVTTGTCASIPTAGASVFDQCGVCGGDGTSCLDCVGVPNGTTLPGSACTTGQPGQCSTGVYIGTAPNCTCDPNPPSAEVCDDIDNDCDGEIDEGIGACRDCNGVLNGAAKEDVCGVCEGDASACCVDHNITETQFQLDGGAKKQEKLIRKLLVEFRQRSGGTLTGRNLRFSKRVRSQARELQISNWVLSWTLPSVFSACESTLCVSISNEPTLSTYRTQSEELRALTETTANRILRKLGDDFSRRAKRFISKAQRLHDSNLALSDTVPAAASACS